MRSVRQVRCDLGPPPGCAHGWPAFTERSAPHLSSAGGVSKLKWNPHRQIRAGKCLRCSSRFNRVMERFQMQYRVTRQREGVPKSPQRVRPIRPARCPTLLVAVRAGASAAPFGLGAYSPRGVQIGISPLRIPKCYSFSAGGRIQLVKNRADVELDSVLRDTETRRDIFVDEPSVLRCAHGRPYLLRSSGWKPVLD
jgi:hypothetical protein